MKTKIKSKDSLARAIQHPALDVWSDQDATLKAAQTNAAGRATREIQRGDPSQCCQNTLTSDFPAMAFPPMKFIRSYKQRGGL